MNSRLTLILQNRNLLLFCKMIQRLVKKTLRNRLADAPAVALLGPRQVGKTTLARHLSDRYFDLEQESERLRLDLEWEDVTHGAPIVVLDEAQTFPEVFARLRGTIDADRKRNGRFLLLGSVSPALMTQVSESLAGRLSIVELTPLLWNEVPTQAAQDRLWLMGGFPDGGVLKPRTFPQWYDDYARLLIERDLPTWGLPAKPRTTARLFKMLAAVHGQLWNASQLGKSLGLTYHTVNSYLDYLEGAFLIRRLPAYHANVRKRLVKSPKIYWRDTGFLHALMGVTESSALLEQPWVGASWEGFVIEQILGHLSARGRRFDAHHFRTSDGKELDLVLELEGETWAVEVKLTASPGPHDMRRLDEVANLIGANRRFVVSQARRALGDEWMGSVNLGRMLEFLG